MSMHQMKGLSHCTAFIQASALGAEQNGLLIQGCEMLDSVIVNSRIGFWGPKNFQTYVQFIF